MADDSTERTFKPDDIQQQLTRPGKYGDAPDVSGTPRQIGHYRIVEMLGEGGMGAVYKAEQRQPIRRTVAIKIIKLGFDTREVIARFESERQALARMDHRHVAKVLDAATTESGRPYFVMEYVPGMPITRFADENKLTIRQRLELFTQACDAIAHAHTKAIIHRDVKASNVLAYLDDGTPTVKVIDFGIAKALTGDRLTDRTFNTDRGQIIGSYDSMSPEQADGSPDIDTRTDVYSLGVLLYELLTGVKPFDHETLAKAADYEVRRIIREVEPPRPSTRLTSMGESATKIAAFRQARVDQLTRQLRSELEWIPLKAMRKERARRYVSPRQLAHDIANYLEHRPLIAGPDSRVYRIRKFTSKRRVAIGAVALFAISIALLTGWYIRGIRIEQRKTKSALDEARKQERMAKQQAGIAEAVNTFLGEMLNAADPDRMLGDKVTVLQATQQALKKLDSGALMSEPLTEAAVRDEIGGTLRSLSRYEEAEPVLRRAVALRRGASSVADLGTAQSINQLALLLQDQGRYPEAEPLFREALDIRRKSLPAGHVKTAESLTNLAVLLLLENRLSEAGPLAREAVDIQRKNLPAASADLSSSLNNLAVLLKAQGKANEAEPLFRESLELRRKYQPAGHRSIAQGLGNLASLLEDQGKFIDAEPLFREALDIDRKTLPVGHPDVAGALNNLGLNLKHQGKLADAEPFLREALEIMRRTLPAGHRNIATTLSNLASLLKFEGKYDQAEPLYREALEIYRKSLPAGHPDIAMGLNNLGLLLKSRGKLDEAEPPLREALEIRRSALPAGHRDTANSLNSLASLLCDRGKFDQAESLYRQALEIDRKALPAAHPDVALDLYNLAMVMRDEGKLADAEPYAREAFEISERAQSNPVVAAVIMSIWGVTLADQKRYEEARKPLEEAWAKFVETRATTKQSTARRVVESLIRVADATGRTDEAIKWRSVLAELRAATRPSTNATTQNRAARGRARRGQFASRTGLASTFMRQTA